MNVCMIANLRFLATSCERTARLDIDGMEIPHSSYWAEASETSSTSSDLVGITYMSSGCHVSRYGFHWKPTFYVTQLELGRRALYQIQPHNDKVAFAHIGLWLLPGAHLSDQSP
jgi:hypothetical protein